jgi:hypothetical protein
MWKLHLAWAREGRRTEAARMRVVRRNIRRRRNRECAANRECGKRIKKCQLNWKQNANCMQDSRVECLAYLAYIISEDRETCEDLDADGRISFES